MKTVLLTGATGFIGSHCIDPLLSKGYKVFAVSSKPQASSASALQWIHLDLKNEKKIEEELRRLKPSHLLHLAWYAEPPHYWQSYENILWLQSSLHLLKVFLEEGGRRVVMAGTCAEYEWKHAECHELETPCIPESLYGTAKYSLFLLGKRLAALSNASFAWGRLFHLFGPGEHPKKLIRMVISGLLQEKPVSCSSGEQIRDYLYVQDAADAMTSLLDADCQGAVNIGSGQPMQIREILKKIVEKIGNEELLQLGSMTPRLSDPLLLVPCTARLNNEVRWKSKREIGEGLDKMISWVRNEIHN